MKSALLFFTSLLLTLSLTGCMARTSLVTPSSGDVCGHIRDLNDREQCISRLESASLHKINTPKNIDTGSTSFLLIGPWIWTALYYLLGIVIGRFVYLDARSRDWLAFAIPPIWWAVLCIFDPALGILVYWAVHYSRLARKRNA